MSSIRGVTVEEAVRRPHPDRHNIWELIVHAAYWKYRVCARLTDLPRGSFTLKGSNFFRAVLTPTRRLSRALRRMTSITRARFSF
ncbi:MAG: DinB family protein [Rhodothermales bacterium]